MAANHFTHPIFPFPLPARIASIQAAKAGISVTIGAVGRSISWRGSEAAFRQQKIISPGMKIPTRSVRHAFGQMRGRLNREGDDLLCYVIDQCQPTTSLRACKLAHEAMVDGAYLRFREVLLAPLEAGESL